MGEEDVWQGQRSERKGSGGWHDGRCKSAPSTCLAAVRRVPQRRPSMVTLNRAGSCFRVLAGLCQRMVSRRNGANPPPFGTLAGRRRQCRRKARLRHLILESKLGVCSQGFGVLAGADQALRAPRVPWPLMVVNPTKKHYARTCPWASVGATAGAVNKASANNLRTARLGRGKRANSAATLTAARLAKKMCGAPGALSQGTWGKYLKYCKGRGLN